MEVYGYVFYLERLFRVWMKLFVFELFFSGFFISDMVVKIILLVRNLCLKLK